MNTNFYIITFLSLFFAFSPRILSADSIGQLKIDNKVIKEIVELGDSIRVNENFQITQVQNLPQFANIQQYNQSLLMSLVDVINPTYLKDIDTYSTQYQMCGFLVENFFADPKIALELDDFYNTNYKGIDKELASQKLLKYHQNLLFDILLHSTEWNISLLNTNKTSKIFTNKILENLFDSNTEDNVYYDILDFIILNHTSQLFLNNN